MTLAELKKLWSWDVLDNKEVRINAYKGQESMVEIPETLQGKPVTKIGFRAFSPGKERRKAARKDYLANELKQIVIPDSVKYIDIAAFAGCAALTSVRLPLKLRTIEQSLFSSCTSLEELHIPTSVRTIESWAFAGCTALKRLYIKEAKVDGSASSSLCPFRGSEQLTLYTKPDGQLAAYAAKRGIPCKPFDMEEPPLSSTEPEDFQDEEPVIDEPMDFSACELCGSIFGVIHIPLADQEQTVCLCYDCVTGGVDPARWWKCPTCEYHNKRCPMQDEMDGLEDGIRTQSSVLTAEKITDDCYQLRCRIGGHTHTVGRNIEIHAAIPCACEAEMAQPWQWNGDAVTHAPMWCWQIDNGKVQYKCPVCGAIKELTMEEAACSCAVEFEATTYSASSAGDFSWSCPVHGVNERKILSVREDLQNLVRQNAFLPPCCCE